MPTEARPADSAVGKSTFPTKNQPHRCTTFLPTTNNTKETASLGLLHLQGARSWLSHLVRRLAWQTSYVYAVSGIRIR